MGLDSVELLVEVEKYFGIKIPIPEAEKIYTVQGMVDSIANHLNLTENNFELRDRILERINKALFNLKLSNANVELTDNISNYLLPGDANTWNIFKQELNLNIPTPTKVNAIKTIINWTPNYDWKNITVDQFITAICANNYDQLLNKRNIKGIHEIYIAVTAITVSKIGVDYYEITPEKSFTSDLGID